MQEKISDTTKFATATAADLLSVDDDVLAELKNTDLMTAAQLSGIKSKVQGMSKANREKFLGHVNKDALKGSLAILGALDFGATAGDLLGAVKDAYPSGLDTSALNDLGNLVPELSPADLAALGSSALEGATGFAGKLSGSQMVSLGGSMKAKMTGAQLSGIAADVSEMSKERMETFMEKVAGPAFEESVEAFGLVQDWADDKAPIVLAKAKEAWGATTEWGAQQFDKVNTLVAKIPVEELQALSVQVLATTDAVAEMTGQQVAALAGKAHGMTADHFEAFVDKVANPAFDASVEAFGQAKSWSAEKAPILKAKVEKVWGPAKDWSGEKINKMGSFAHAAVTDHIPELAGEAFSGAAELLGQNADWTAQQLNELSAKAKEA